MMLGPVRATRSEKILADGIESDDSDKDQYRPEEADLMQEISDDDDNEADEGEDKQENEKKVVASKKGKKRPNLDAVTLLPFKPLFPQPEQNLLLNIQSVVSIARGQFHRIYTYGVCTNISL